LQVVEHGSFQRASVALRTSRGGLRRRVGRLERDLGVSLLSRRTRGIEPTEAGAAAVASAGGLLREASALSERVRNSGANARGVLHVIVPLGMSAEARARAFTLLRAVSPELGVEVIEAEDPLTLLREPFDLMLHFGDAPRRDGWYSHVIFRLAVTLRATPAYLDKHGRPGSLDELDAHTLLQWSAPGTQARGLPLLGGGSFSCVPWLRSANIEMLCKLALDGAGIVFAPVTPASFGGQEEGLEPVLDTVVGSAIDVRALSPRPSRVDPRARAMLENIQRMLGGRGEAASMSDDR